MSYLLILVLLLGFAPAFIARSKGRKFLPWWIYGTALGPFAMVHAMMMRDIKSEYPTDRVGDDRTEADAPWPAFLWLVASLMIAAVAVFAYRMVVPTDSVRASAPTVAMPGGSARQDERRVVTQAPTRSLATAKPEMAARNRVPAVDPQSSEKRASSTRMRSTERAANRVPDAKSSHSEAPIPQDPTNTERSVSVPTLVPPPPVAAAPLPKESSETAPPARTARPAAPATPPDVEKYKSALAMRSPSKVSPPSKPRPKTKVRKKPAAPDPDVNAVGEIVLIVQRGLAERGYDPGAINGRAHKKTQSAIRLFQIDRNIEPTGTIDQALLESLNIVGPRLKVFRTPPAAPSRR